MFINKILKKLFLAKNIQTHLGLNLYQYKFLRYKLKRQKKFPINLEKISVPCEKGLVSVVLPVYNGEKYIDYAINSVLTQTYKKIELIIVDDGSEDNTANIVDEYAKKDDRITVVHQKNNKIPISLSRGFSMAVGEFYTWISADNIMHPTFIEKMLAELKAQPSVAMVYANMRLIDATGRIYKKHGWYEIPAKSGNVILPNNTLELNTYPNNTIGAAFMYRSVAAKVLGDYSRYKYTLEDYDYWMRMNSLFEIKHVSFAEPIYDYRWHQGSLTAQDKSLAITANRSKLMVLDDFRRDFYLTGRMTCENEELFTSEDDETILNILDAKAKNDYLYNLEKMIALKKKYKKRLSAVVCCRNAQDGVVNAVASLCAQTRSPSDYEIILINNNPQNSDIKKAFDELLMSYPNCHLVYFPEPTEGLSFARNTALWHAQGEFILYMDDDALADENLINETIKCFEANPQYGVIGGQIILQAPKTTPTVLTERTKVLWSHLPIAGNKLIESKKYDEFPYGANFGVRTQVLMEIGGFRTQYGRKGKNFAGGEETAVCFMMKEMKMKVGLNPLAKVMHCIASDRYTIEHIKKTTISGIITQYKLRRDLYAPLDWSENYVKGRVQEAQRHLSRLPKGSVPYIQKQAEKHAFEMVLQEMNRDHNLQLRHLSCDMV